MPSDQGTGQAHLSCKSTLFRDLQSDRLNSTLGIFTTRGDCIPILGSLCKVGSWTNRQTGEHKMKLAEKGTKKNKNKVDQRSTQNDLTSFSKH